MRPERVGRYLVFDEIAAGGMAAVHVGRLVGPAGFGRLVAIKRLHAHLQKDPDFVAMLLDEARIASRIYHPNVVQVLDVVTEGGLFLVLEYVHGESLWKLARRLRERGERLDPAIAVAVVAAALRGLHAAHETVDEDGAPLGIVHRDVSPHNILVDADGSARLVDFGIAKAAGRITSTRDGQVKGKVAYMSPEQLRNQHVDRRADVYAASVVLWELLTGERLFTSGDITAAVTRVLDDDIRPPRALAPELPAALEAVVLRGLARDVADRFATAAAMADALEAACVPAPPSRVAAWVVANWPLASARRERLAEISRGTPLLDDTEGTASAIDVAAPSRPAADPSADREPVRGAPRRSRSLLMVVAVAMVTAALLGATTAWLGDRPEAARSAAPMQTASPSPAPSPSPANTSSSATDNAGGARPPPAPASGEPPPAAPKTADVASAAHRSTTPSKPAIKPAAKRATTCEPPYTLDAEGNHIWKRECFK